MPNIIFSLLFIIFFAASKILIMYKYLTAIVLAVITISSCKQDGPKKTESGLHYQFFTKSNGGKPQKGDILSMDMIYKTETDSILFNSKERVGDNFKIELKESTFKGGVEEGFAMMSAGDSAEFKVVADSVFEKTFGAQLPPFIKKGSLLTFNIKMKNIQTKADYEKEMEAKKQEAVKNEASVLEKYLNDNKITTPANPSGLYYIEKLKGTGSKAEKGSKVSVHYKGTLLDGTVFDQSKEKPIEFTLGVGEVIPGWDEGIGMMQEGGKAKLVIPSSLGYGPRGSGPIPPSSSLVFEVELVKVLK